MDFLIEQPAPKTNSVWDKYVPILESANHYHAYLHDEISNPNEYSELCYLLDNAYPGSVVHLHINTPGGILDSAVQIIDAISRSKAKVIAHLTGSVASAGTLIALSCDELVVSNFVQFMIHNYSGGTGGKGHEIKAMVEFSDKELNKTFKTIYSDFLTDAEMETVIDGRDIWLNADEVKERWERVQNAKNQS